MHIGGSAFHVVRRTEALTTQLQSPVDTNMYMEGKSTPVHYCVVVFVRPYHLLRINVGRATTELVDLDTVQIDFEICALVATWLDANTSPGGNPIPCFSTARLGALCAQETSHKTQPLT